MDDIKRRKNPLPPKKSPPRPSEPRPAIEAVWEANKIVDDKPQFKQKKSISKRVVGIVSIVVCVIIIAGVGAYIYRDSVSMDESERNSESTVSLEKSDNDSNVIVSVETDNDSIFNPQAYYGILVEDKTLYFARIVEASEQFYRLQDIFYQEEQIIEDEEVDSFAIDTAVESQANKITLVKFGTEEYLPEDELVLPEEQVMQIFLLSEDSPILKAILQYYEKN